MTAEFKEKNDLPDLYNILGINVDVCKDSNCDELIKKAYIKRAKACHPDKHPGRADIAEIFQLVTMAYDILKNEKDRSEYNHKLSLDRQSSNDFLKLKKETQNYAKMIGEYVPPNDQQKLSFTDQMTQLNIKHGYDSSQTNVIPITDAKKKVHDMTKLRATQDRELMPEKLFDGHIDLKKFNAAFDKLHPRENNSIVPHNGIPSAWNDMGAVTNFSAFDTTNSAYDNLYVEDNNRLDTSRQSYGTIDVDTAVPMPKITKKDLDSIRGADYVDGHNIIDENYYSDMKAALRGRNTDASDFENMTYGDFKRDDTAGYGIFDKLGLNFDDRLSLDIDDDNISKKYEKLMAERQKEILPCPQSGRLDWESQTINQALAGINNDNMDKQSKKSTQRFSRGGR